MLSAGHLALEVHQAMQTHGGRWLCLLESVTDHRDLELLLLPGAWALLTTRRASLLQPLGLEAWEYPVRFLTEAETVQVVVRRMGSQWDKHNDLPKARDIYVLVGGWPLAVGLAASVARSRGWAYLLRRLADPTRALAVLRVDRGDTPATSMRLALVETVRGLSPDATALLHRLCGQTANTIGDDEAALAELCDLGLAEQTRAGPQIPRLLALYMAEEPAPPCAL